MPAVLYDRVFSVGLVVQEKFFSDLGIQQDFTGCLEALQLFFASDAGLIPLETGREEKSVPIYLGQSKRAVILLLVTGETVGGGGVALRERGEREPQERATHGGKRGGGT